jgi:hypothetical protein
MNRLSRPSWAKLPAVQLPSWAKHRGNSQRPQRPAQRVAVTSQRADKFIRRLTGAAVLLVALIAAVVSFTHIEHLAVTHGQTFLAAVLLPVSIDGTVAASSLVMMRAARLDLDTPWLARVMLVLAVVATLGANILFGIRYGYVGAALSGWPAVAFIGCTEMSIGMIRRARPDSGQAVSHGSLAGVLGWPPVAVAKRATVPVSENTGTVAPTPVLASVPQAVPPRAPRKRARGSGRKSAETHLTRAEKAFKEHIESGTLPSLRSVMDKCSVGQHKGREIREHLSTLIASAEGQVA